MVRDNKIYRLMQAPIVEAPSPCPDSNLSTDTEETQTEQRRSSTSQGHWALLSERYWPTVCMRSHGLTTVLDWSIIPSGKMCCKYLLVAMGIVLLD